MSGASDDFIKDLHNASIYMTYYDEIAKGIWFMMVSKLFNYHLKNILNIYEKYL